MQRIEDVRVEKEDGLKSCSRRTHERICRLGSVERRENECVEVDGTPMRRWPVTQVWVGHSISHWTQFLLFILPTAIKLLLCCRHRDGK